MKKILIAVIASMTLSTVYADEKIRCSAKSNGIDYTIQIHFVGGYSDTSQEEVRFDICQSKKIDEDIDESCKKIGLLSVNGTYIELDYEDVDFIRGKNLDENIMVKLEKGAKKKFKLNLLNVEANYWDLFEEGPKLPKEYLCPNLSM